MLACLSLLLVISECHCPLMPMEHTNPTDIAVWSYARKSCYCRSSGAEAVVSTKVNKPLTPPPICTPHTRDPPPKSRNLSTEIPWHSPSSAICCKELYFLPSHVPDTSLSQHSFHQTNTVDPNQPETVLQRKTEPGLAKRPIQHQITRGSSWAYAKTMAIWQNAIILPRCYRSAI